MNDANGSIDLTGGRDPESDFVIAEPPADPSRLEGSSMWIWDDTGDVGLPRFAVDARGASWTTERMVGLNVAMADGRVYTFRANDPPHAALGDDGMPRVLGGGPLRLESIEPFRHWRARFSGTPGASHARRQMHGTAPESLPDVLLSFEIDAIMTIPAWTQGSLGPKGQFVAGEDRFEQLFTAQGHLSIDGRDRTFTGGGLRVHRKGGGRSDMSTWRGHCWQ